MVFWCGQLFSRHASACCDDWRSTTAAEVCIELRYHVLPARPSKSDLVSNMLEQHAQRSRALWLELPYQSIVCSCLVVMPKSSRKNLRMTHAARAAGNNETKDHSQYSTKPTKYKKKT
jgi:hypothetical protein